MWRNVLVSLVLLAACSKAPIPDLPVDNLVAIPAGSFTAGSRELEGCNPPEQIKVGSFLIAQYETTVSQYARYLNAVQASPPAGSQFLVDGDVVKPDGNASAEPVVMVSYSDALKYCEWLSKETGFPVSLPSEVQWEYAARGGLSRTPYPWGWGSPHGRACFDAEDLCPAGSHEPNRWGLHDMAGNVFEWCLQESPDSDTTPARGGAWSETDPRMLTVCRRTYFPVDYTGRDVGFRIVVAGSEAE